MDTNRIIRDLTIIKFKGDVMREILKKVLLILSIIVLGIMGNAQAFELDLSEEEKEVWSMEETYWEFVKNRDLEGYRSLWHEEFEGWPKGLKQPANKDRLISVVKLWFSSITPGSFTFKLTPYTVRLYGDVIIVHYLCQAVWTDHKGKEVSMNDRMTHTWMKQDGKWQIIGGMSAN